MSPSQPINNEPYSTSVDTQLALKVEGVICHGKNTQVFRKIKSVTLTVDITPEERKDLLDIKVYDFVFSHLFKAKSSSVDNS